MDSGLVMKNMATEFLTETNNTMKDSGNKATKKETAIWSIK